MTVKLLATLFLAALVTGCGESKPDTLLGYAEGEYVRVASPAAGRLVELRVQRGAQAQAGDPREAVENENETAQRREAADRLAQAQARLADLLKGRRPEEIAVVQAQVAQADAALELARNELRRTEKLVADKFISRQRLDEAQTTYERDQARVRELRAQLRTMHLAARADEIRAAEAEVGAANASLEQAQWLLDQKAIRAPVAGLVHDTLFVPGEWVPAGAPVVALLPPTHIKVRFFVPETLLGTLTVGQRVTVRCDGCAAPVAAESRYISPQAEYTPPVIYSRDNRAKLLFMVEAWPSATDAPTLHPGQPVDVTLGSNAPGATP
jgi:HlyD family secretion protein